MRPLLIIPPREEVTTPSDTMLKKQKFAIYEKQCSKVAEGLYVSGEAVARDRSLLAAQGITHIVNCVGALYAEYFKADGITYKTLWLNDVPSEDITSILYDTFDFIEAARKGPPAAAAAAAPPQQQQHGEQLLQQQQQPAGSSSPAAPRHEQQQQQGADAMQWSSCSSRATTGADADAEGCSSSSGGGRVLVHCSQGVSRSTTIAIAYLMMKTGGSYEEVYTTMRGLRGVTSPNVGFMCQLITWGRRRQEAPKRVRMYRIAPHCPESPCYLVAKAVSPSPGSSHPDWGRLDSRGCFLLHLPGRLYVWAGRECGPQLLEAGMRAAGGLVRYEGVPQPQLVRQGGEPADLLLALSPGCDGAGSATVSLEQSAVSVGLTAEPSAGSTAAAPAGAAAMEEEAGGVSGDPSAAAGARSGSEQQQQPGAAGGDAAAAGAAGVLVPQPQPGGEGGLASLVGHVDEWSPDFELLRRALLGGGVCSEAGRPSPRSPRLGLAVDDMAVGGSNGGGSGCQASGRADSPGAADGQQQKRTRYRRSDSGQAGPASFRQPGRLSASSNPAPWPAVAAEAAVAAAPAAAAVVAAAAAEPAGTAGMDADEGAEQGCDINRMSIDEGCE